MKRTFTSLRAILRRMADENRAIEQSARSDGNLFLELEKHNYRSGLLTALRLMEDPAYFRLMADVAERA